MSSIDHQKAHLLILHYDFLCCFSKSFLLLSLSFCIFSPGGGFFFSLLLVSTYWLSSFLFLISYTTILISIFLNYIYLDISLPLSIFVPINNVFLVWMFSSSSSESYWLLLLIGADLYGDSSSEFP